MDDAPAAASPPPSPPRRRLRAIALHVLGGAAWILLSTALAPELRLWGLLALGAALLALLLRPGAAPALGAATGRSLRAATFDSPADAASPYRTLVEHAPMAIFRFDPGLHITYHNHCLATLLQVPDERLDGLDMHTLHDQSLTPTFRSALAGSPAQYKGPYHATFSGRRLHIRLNATPVRDGSGRIIAGIAIVEDITAQHEAETMLRESETRYALAMRGTNEGLWDWNPVSRDLYLSSRLLELLGLDDNAARTNSDEWMSHVHPDDRALFRAILIEHLKGRTPHFEMEYRVRHASGHYLWMLARGLALRDEHGQAWRMVGSIGDISARKAAEAALREANRELEARVGERTAQLGAALHELEAFSYSVSHDLRSPLRAIDGYSALLAERYEHSPDDEARMLFGRMRAAVQRMGTLIDDLLDLARVSRQPLHRERVDIGALAHDLVAELREQTPQRRVEVDIADDLVASADPGLIRIVLANLLGNAWKFSAGRDPARIRVGRMHTAAGEAFCVDDNGAGFDMRYRDKLFGAFQRLHGVREFEGTGIGLATVARIVRRHGGEVGAEGEVGIGARFWFTLGGDAGPATPPPSP